MEEWRSISGFEGLYSVSNFGLVRRDLSRTSGKAGHILKVDFDRGGYPRVRLWRDGKASHIFVHRLVAAAFIGPRPEGMQVNHLDGTILNNRPENLEYTTPRGNILHAAAMGLMPTGARSGSRLHPERLHRGDNHYSRTQPERLARGERVHGSRLTAEKVREIRDTHALGDVTFTALAQTYGVTRRSITQILNGKTWTHI